MAIFTHNSLPDFYSRPHDFENSEAKFRMLLIISVLQREFGVHYSERGRRNVDFSDSRDPFIHGMLNENRGGTCASMPVLYTAVARRLGYPVDLVLAKTHIFGRWNGQDHPKPAYHERFNIEGTNTIFSYHPDAYYRNWPYPISDAEMERGWYMKPKTAAETLAVFLEIRGCVLMDSGRYREAQLAFVHSRLLAPHNPLADAYIADARHAEVTGVVAARRTSPRPVDGLGMPAGIDPFGIVVDPQSGQTPLVAQRMAQE